MVNHKKLRTIPILLDVQGTLENMNNENIDTFMNQIKCLIQNFQADQAFLIISSLATDPNELIPYMNLLRKHLMPQILLENCYYLNGMIDAETNEVTEICSMYNYNKFLVFEETYLLNQEQNTPVMFLVADDEILNSAARKYQNQMPVCFLRASQVTEERLREDNLMIHSSFTKGFDGVVELLSQYLTHIQSLNCREVVKCQQTECFTLNYYEIIAALEEKNYDLILEHLKQNKIPSCYYPNLIKEVTKMYENLFLSEKIKKQLAEIIEFIPVNSVPLELLKHNC